MEADKTNERAVLVFCNWLVFGLIGLGFLLEGGARENVLIGMIGIIGIIAGFVVHIIINHISSTGFTLGEVALGLVLFALGAVTFILSWIIGAMPLVAFRIGLLLLAVLVVGFLVYVATRYGVAGAFRKFDVIGTSNYGKREP